MFNNSLVRVTLRFLEKGVPHEFSMICQPNSEDYQLWKQSSSLVKYNYLLFI
jgi:hypothetical protein